MAVTIKDIARMANVSVATVSRVLNNKPGISEKRRKAIIDLAEQVGYLPNQSAQNLVRQRTHMLGFIASDLRSRAYVDFVQTIEAGCRPRGYRVLIADSEGRVDSEKDNVNDMIRYRAEGLLIFPIADLDNNATLEHLMMLRLRKIPFVVLGGSRVASFDSVVLAEAEGGYMIARHLLDLGHQRLALIGMPQQANPGAMERCEGVMRAMQERGLLGDTPEEPAMRIAYDDGAGCFIPQTTSWLTQPDAPTAIIALNANVVLRLVRPILIMGKRIPDDVSLVCFGQEGWCSNFYPSISCARVDNQMRAQRAFDLLFKRMEDPDSPVMVDTVHYTLVERESTAPPQ